MRGSTSRRQVLLALLDSCDIGFRVQFNAEFPRQVIKSPIQSRFPSILLPQQFKGTNRFVDVK